MNVYVVVRQRSESRCVSYVGSSELDATDWCNRMACEQPEEYDNGSFLIFKWEVGSDRRVLVNEIKLGERDRNDEDGPE